MRAHTHTHTHIHRGLWAVRKASVGLDLGRGLGGSVNTHIPNPDGLNTSPLCTTRLFEGHVYIISIIVVCKKNILISILSYEGKVFIFLFVGRHIFFFSWINQLKKGIDFVSLVFSGPTPSVGIRWSSWLLWKDWNMPSPSPKTSWLLSGCWMLKVPTHSAISHTFPHRDIYLEIDSSKFHENDNRYLL